MLFNTVQYLLFLPIVVLTYYCVPVKVRYIWLLIVSYYFYMQWNPLYILLLFLSTFLTYFCGRLIENFHACGKSGKGLGIIRKKQKACLLICILLNLGVLAFFKYFNFGIQLLNHLLAFIHIDEVNWHYDILLPVGISFYTLQALGYLIDVYRGDIYAEKSFLKYALFVSFFPQLVAGPIERSRNLLVQLHEVHSFRYENLRKGLLLVLYGLFLKMVIADKAAVIVDIVYENSAVYSGFYIMVATFLFAIQIYCDFYGYSTIAKGSALMLGIHLMENFSAPYYATSVKEFWRRWHISLSNWFRDYLYIPLGGNRKGSIRQKCNLLVVFGVSGLWHGASVAFIVWGLLNGIYQIIEDTVVRVKTVLTEHLREKLWIMNRRCVRGGKRNLFSIKLRQTIVTFCLVTFAWLFFRAGGFKDAIEILKNMLGSNNWTILFDGSLYELGVPKYEMNALLAGIVVLFSVDYYKYREKDVADIFLNQEWYFRVAGIMLLIFTILLFGCYGEQYDVQRFIYFQF